MNSRVSKSVGLAALMGLVPLAAMAGATTASAATDASAKPAVSCKHLSANKQLTGPLRGCTVAATGGSGTISNFLPTGGTVAWVNGTTTVYTSTLTTTTASCPAGSTAFGVTGSVTSSTNAAIHVGAPVNMSVCVGVKKITNAPGTRVTF